MTKRLAVIATAALAVAVAAGALHMEGNQPGEHDVPDGSDPARQQPATKPMQPELPRSSCEPGLANCVVARGRVIYVEAVDPDGDGDAHFVTTSEAGVTFPGITVFDVRTDLRPDPLPGVGDLVGGAGPVYRGSHGQKQIQVTEFHVAR